MHCVIGRNRRMEFSPFVFLKHFLTFVGFIYPLLGGQPLSVLLVEEDSQGC